MVDGFMGSPEWSSGIAKDNIKFVNVSGQMTFMEKPITAEIQFILKGEESFEGKIITENGYDVTVNGSLAVINFISRKK